MRQRRQHIRVTILPPNIFSTEVALGPGGSSGGEGELDCLSFWQILVPVFSSSCSLARGAKGFRPHAWVTHVYTRAGDGTGNTLARVLRTSTHAIYLNLHKAHKPATKSCARAPRALMRKHTGTHSGKHSVHTHTYPPRTCFPSAPPERAPTRSPCPHLLHAFHKRRATAQFPGRDSAAQGRGASPQHPLQTRSPEQSQAPSPLPIQQVLQVLRAVLLGAGAEPGCPGCRKEVLWRNGGTLQPKRERDKSGAGGPLTNQLHSVPGLRVTLGSHCLKLPASSFIPSCPSLTSPILPSPCHLRAWHPHRGCVFLPLFVAIPSA